METSAELEVPRKEPSSRTPRHPTQPETETPRLLSNITQQAMDGFEEWLRAFKEELASRS